MTSLKLKPFKFLNLDDYHLLITCHPGKKIALLRERGRLVHYVLEHPGRVERVFSGTPNLEDSTPTLSGLLKTCRPVQGLFSKIISSGSDSWFLAVTRRQLTFSTPATLLFSFKTILYSTSSRQSSQSALRLSNLLKPTSSSVIILRNAFGKYVSHPSPPWDRATWESATTLLSRIPSLSHLSIFIQSPS